MPEPATSSWKYPRFAIVVALLLIQIGVVGGLAYVRLGDPASMPDQLLDLAHKLGNSRAQLSEVPPAWVQLCRAWDTWLPVVRNDAPRLLRTEGLLQPDGYLWQELSRFLADADELRPEALIPAAAGEKRLAVLAKSPPPAVMAELLVPRVAQRVSEAGARVMVLAMRLETWVQWDEMRSLLKHLQRRGLVKAAAALQPRLPPARGTPDYRLSTPRTLRLLNGVSLDPAALLLFTRWSEFSRRAAEMQTSADPDRQALPDRLLDQLTDQSTLAELADSLAGPLEEMRRLGPGTSSLEPVPAKTPADLVPTRNP